MTEAPALVGPIVRAERNALSLGCAPPHPGGGVAGGEHPLDSERRMDMGPRGAVRSALGQDPSLTATIGVEGPLGSRSLSTWSGTGGRSELVGGDAT